MSLFKTTLCFFNQHLTKLSWFALSTALFLLFMVSWGLMFLAKETELVAPNVWFYYFITTATTIGYGDYSPQSVAGRWVAALIIMPCSVVVFAGFVGKLSKNFVELWRRNMQGKGDYSELHDHIVIIGWHPEQTPKMVDLIFGDQRRKDRKVVLCCVEEMENPLPDKVVFVRGESFHDEKMLQRAGVSTADRLIVYCSDDEKTLTTCLVTYKMCHSGHIVAWFEKEHMVKLMQTHCPEVECHSRICTEMLVRSAQDPGSSRVQMQLLSTLSGPTQYSMKIPDDFGGTSFQTLLATFKMKHEAIVFGVADSKTGDNLRLNPNRLDRVEAGQMIYFMAQQRIHAREIDWNALLAGKLEK